MPKGWDLASLWSNVIRLDEAPEIMLERALRATRGAVDPVAFKERLRMRLALSVAVNQALVARGHSDRAFAARQLERLPAMAARLLP
jgi:hypothetical protein